MKKRINGLKCKECGRDYDVKPMNVCEFCFGPLEVDYDYEEIARRVSRKKIQAGPASLWRYADFLPVDDGADKIDLNAGYSPLQKARRLGEALGLNELYVKNDTMNPTFSFKDRVVAVAVSKAMEFGFDTVACASTGNLANSVAAHAAAAGLRSFVFIPQDLEQGKVAASAVYEPQLIKVRGHYDDVNRLCSEIADKYRWAFVNINVRPYYSEGSKTLAYETAEQLGWKAPDQVVVPMASGSLLTKIYKGLREMETCGLIQNVRTKINGAQALGCSPIVSAFKEGRDIIHPVKPNTIARSLAIGNPADGYYALKAMERSGGTAESVTDDEVREGIRLLARTEGIFAETAGGVTVAALKKMAAAGRFDRDETVVAYVTGIGFKTLEAVLDGLPEARLVDPNVTAFEEAVGAKLLYPVYERSAEAAV